MSDLHPLPLIGHDLPEYVNNAPPKREKVKVSRDETFFGERCWRWEHNCAYRGGVTNYGYPEPSWRRAYSMGLAHAERCC